MLLTNLLSWLCNDISLFPLPICMADINGTGTDVDMFLIVAEAVGTLCFTDFDW